MADLKKMEEQPITFDAIRIGLASPEKIREWSTRNNDPKAGVVEKPETINYRTLKPEKEGLFCEKIFGPSKDWECHCGKYRKIRYKGVICDKCGVEVTKSNVRRERMGRIELAAPVSHIWYFKGIPSRIGTLLNLTPKELESVLYFSAYIVLDPKDTELEMKQVIREYEYKQVRDKYDKLQEEHPEKDYNFVAEMGAEAIQKLLKEIDLDQEMATLKEELKNESTKGKGTKLIKRLEVVEALRDSGNRPEWMIMDTIPVIPPDLRPMVQLDGGRFATSDLNDLYRRIINRNNRLQKLLDLGAPEIIINNEKRMLQEAVDALIDNGRKGKAVTGPGNRSLKSLSDMLKGKGGRFRQNLLGKRVDYSGRSVIVVGPELKIYQCGLPKEMAIELFKPFVMKELVSKGMCQNIKAAKKMVEKQDTKVWDVLEEVIMEHPVMLNRAPTLHRLGIQAFEPILVEGKAIKLHPLVCTAFNADFDGDQMAVHLPLSVEAQAECRFLLLSPNNLLKPSDGAPVAVPSQDMVLGIYYLTQERPGSLGEGHYYKNINEAILAYENGYLDLHGRIKVRMTRTLADGRTIQGTVESTLGRFLFNEILPQDLGFVKRKTDEDILLPEVDFLVGKKQLKQILEKVINTHGATQTAEVLDLVKAIGYKYSTRAAMTVSIADMTVPKKKKEMIEQAQENVDRINFLYQRGRSTNEERYNNIITLWKNTDDALTKELMDGLDSYNNIKMMADSGARGSKEQIKQLVGMRGLMADTSGNTIELPVKSNFREGLDVLEYFISAHGARKGLSDTALRTADSGYLTRRMVDICQSLIIRENDCSEGRSEIPGRTISSLLKDNTERINVADDNGKKEFIGRYLAEDIKGENGTVIAKANSIITPKLADEIIATGLDDFKVYDEVEKLENRVRGRFAAEDVLDDQGEVIVKANQMITPKRAAAIQSAGIASVKIRTSLACKSRDGICAKCYGANMATGEPVQIGEAVGIIAAQSIGEPGTQLTMRTFHTGGVAGNDITQGLPRVEELFEARKPKGLAVITAIGGKVSIEESNNNRKVTIKNDEEVKVYDIPYGATLKVREGDDVEAGHTLTDGSVDPHELLTIKDMQAVETYLVQEVQKVYGSQGVDLADKHIEVIIRQMMKKQMVEDPGDSDLLPGSLEDRLKIEERNEQLEAEGKNPIVVKDIILGITKAALATDSFLAAASFQETAKVLTEAAIKGKVDPLIGLKENVIIGKLIPAGTGISRYRKVKLNVDEAIPQDEDEIDFSEDDDNGEMLELSEDEDFDEEFDSDVDDGLEDEEEDLVSVGDVSGNDEDDE
ncbi:MAG: DNA-directed RNA polymerase subunit beta' [Lachnospiraceae bacterium]|nr:DNA-directed RNA polymerase subunit beta' [Lachnospiraceae bacterium]